MLKDSFIPELFRRAKEAGFSDCEAFFSSGSSFSCEVFKGEIVEYSAADTAGLGFRGLINGKMGYASTQAFDDDAIDLLVNGAKENARLIENEDKQFLFEGSETYPEMEGFSVEIENISAAEKIQMAKDMEKRALEADERVRQVSDCSVFSGSSVSVLKNTRGLDLTYRSNVIGGYVNVVCGEQDAPNTGSAYFFTSDPAKVLPLDTADEAVEEAVAGLGAKSCAGGKVPVLFRNDCFATLLSTFSGVFSADAAQKGLSLLSGREGETIASPLLTVLDDPLLKDSSCSSPFDGEGVAAYAKPVIDRGTLTTLLHNLKTAHKQGVKTTANASRVSYASVVGVAPTNFYVQNGETPKEELFKVLSTGLYVTDLMGMHSGANAISGDFSLGAKGFWVEEGKPVRPVSNITVAGNFFDVLKNVSAVGNDLRFTLPGASLFGSPSVLVAGLSVAGEAKA